jgi:hypothetical protein
VSCPPCSGHDTLGRLRAVDGLLAAARTGQAHPCDAAFGLRVTEILAEAETLLGGGTGVPTA